MGPGDDPSHQASLRFPMNSNSHQAQYPLQQQPFPPASSSNKSSGAYRPPPHSNYEASLQHASPLNNSSNYPPTHFNEQQQNRMAGGTPHQSGTVMPSPNFPMYESHVASSH